MTHRQYGRRETRGGGRCAVAPSPELQERMKTELRTLSAARGPGSVLRRLISPMRQAPGLNDGLIIPGNYFPAGTSLERVRRAAAERAPLRGTLNVIVVLVDFSDRPM